MQLLVFRKHDKIRLISQVGIFKAFPNTHSISNDVLHIGDPAHIVINGKSGDSDCICCQA